MFSGHCQRVELKVQVDSPGSGPGAVLLLFLRYFLWCYGLPVLLCRQEVQKRGEKYINIFLQSSISFLLIYF